MTDTLANQLAGLDMDQREFRGTMGLYPTGVVIISAITESGPAGMAVNSFTSVSLDPPLIAFCPMRTSQTWAAIKEVGSFAVSFLASGQEDVARLLASKNVDRFGSHEWVAAPSGHPVLSTALAWIDATVHEIFAGGDHEVVLADVRSHLRKDQRDPLVFFGGRYRALKGA
jgi:flavin reductase (DIM6/NTAB) family NADH-FMN oxidoreductase RutF